MPMWVGQKIQEVLRRIARTLAFFDLSATSLRIDTSTRSYYH